MSPALLAGRYRLRDPLGNGGMGRVWLARDEVLHRDVAIKEVNLPLDLSPAERDELRTRTLREARTAARLSHSNVVQIYDVLGIDDRPWIVMEYIHSRSLQQILLTDGPLDPQRAAVIGLAILRALAAAHSAGVLHRDVKPGNVLITEDGRVVLTDFGLATFESGDASVTRPGLVWGSPEYVAPERARHGVSSVEADLWSFGATMYAAVEGASPYARPTAMASLTALATEKPPTPQNAGPLKPVITGLLRKDPRARLRTAEVERLLLRAADGEPRGKPRRLPRQRPAPAVESGAGTSVVPIASYALPEPPPLDPGGSAPSTPDPPAARPDRSGPGRRGWLIATSAVLLTVVLAGAAVLYANRSDRGDSPPAGAGSQSGPQASTGAPKVVVTSIPPIPTDKLRPPEGWAYYQEDGRFRMIAPIGWIVERAGTVTTFHEPDGRKVLTVDRWPVPEGGPVAGAAARDRAWQAGTDSPPANYQRIELRQITYIGEGVDWEYTYTDPDNEPMVTISRWFAKDGICYAIALSLPKYDLVSRTQFFHLPTSYFNPIP